MNHDWLDADGRPTGNAVWVDGNMQVADKYFRAGPGETPTQVESANVSIDPTDHGLLYGDGVFEGIRCYRKADGSLYILKLRSHMERLFNGIQALKLHGWSASGEPVDFQYTLESLESQLRTIVDVAHDEFCEQYREKFGEEPTAVFPEYIRLVVSRGAGDLGLSPWKCPTPSVIAICGSLNMFKAKGQGSDQPAVDDGPKEISVVFAKTQRNSNESTPPQIKSLNYLNNILAQIEAREGGATEAVMFNAQGEVTECTGDNIFIVNRDGAILTPPVSAGLLPGITRAVVINDLAPGEVQERTLVRDDLESASEFFVTGTGAEIAAVTTLGGADIGDGKPGPVTKKLYAAFRKLLAEQAPED